MAEIAVNETNKRFERGEIILFKILNGEFQKSECVFFLLDTLLSTPCVEPFGILLWSHPKKQLYLTKYTDPKINVAQFETKLFEKLAFGFGGFIWHQKRIATSHILDEKFILRFCVIQ